MRQFGKLNKPPKCYEHVWRTQKSARTPCQKPMKKPRALFILVMAACGAAGAFLLSLLLLCGLAALFALAGANLVRCLVSVAAHFCFDPSPRKLHAGGHTEAKK